MSMGYGGNAVVEVEDERVVIYNYCCFNWNLKIYAAEEEFYTGEICIKKPALEEYRQGASLTGLREERKILISDAYETWDRENGMDIVGKRLIVKILNEYKEKGTLPKRVSVCW